MRKLDDETANSRQGQRLAQSHVVQKQSRDALHHLRLACQVPKIISNLYRLPLGLSLPLLLFFPDLCLALPPRVVDEPGCSSD